MTGDAITYPPKFTFIDILNIVFSRLRQLLHVLNTSGLMSKEDLSDLLSKSEPHLEKWNGLSLNHSSGDSVPFYLNYSLY